jgi:hypothetical protein
MPIWLRLSKKQIKSGAWQVYVKTGGPEIVTYPDGSPCDKQREVNRLAQADRRSARSPGSAVISHVFGVGDSLIYPEDKPGGSRRLLLYVMTAEVTEKD